MSTLAELWDWIKAPLEELKQKFISEPEQSWETRKAEFLQGLGIRKPNDHPVTEQMFEHLDKMTDDERRDHVTSGQFESVAYGIVQQYAAAQEAGQGHDAGHSQAAAPGYDEGAWQDFLQANGPQWDGTQEAWDQFTQWFLYHANASGVGDPATALIQYLDALSPADRITALSQYGVTIAAAQEPAAQTASPGYDEGTWQDFLQTNASQWNGTQESWDQFTQWFLYHANSYGVAEPATALIQYLDALSPADRITALSQYGVTIAAAQEPVAQQGGAEQGSQADVQIAALMDELSSEFADIPPDRQAEILNDVLRELGAAS